MSKQTKNFKNSKAYKIILFILLVLCIGYRIWAMTSQEEQTVNADNEANISQEFEVVADQPEEEPDYVVDNNTIEEPDVKDDSAEVIVSEANEPSEKESIEEESIEEESTEEESSEAIEIPSYTFRSKSLWESHYEKHGIEMGFADKEEYLQAANMVLANPDTLHKVEKEDGDDVYYLEETNEFVVISTDGYLRTYFNPSDGIKYFNRQ